MTRLLSLNVIDIPVRDQTFSCFPPFSLSTVGGCDAFSNMRTKLFTFAWTQCSFKVNESLIFILFSYLSLSCRFPFPLPSLSIIYFILYAFIIEATDFSMACLWREHNAGYLPIGQRLSDHNSLTLHHSTAPSRRLTPRSQILYPNCQVICIEPNTRTAPTPGFASGHSDFSTRSWGAA